MRKHIITSITLVLASQGVTHSLQAREDTSNMSDRQRIERLERMVESQGLVDLLMRLDSLQQEIQQLRGDSDVTAHTLKEIKKRQRDLYIDIDRRLLQLERGGAAVNLPATTAPASTASSGQDTATGTGSTPVTANNNQAATTFSTPPVNGEEEQNAYQKAFDMLRELRYAEATEAFRSFIKTYPNGRYAHIAQYWLGEAGYAQGNFKMAITDYEALINNYPSSPKCAQALLKIGYSQDKLKDKKSAIASFDKVIKMYPGTTEAGQAQKMLKNIKSGNN